MPEPRPSLTLVLDVDEQYASPETRLEVNRCYTHVCSTVFRSHETPEGQTPENVAQFLVKFGSNKYLFSTDDGADDLWDTIIEKWLFNTFYKVANNMQIYNRRQREIGGQELYFDWLDVDLQNKGLIVRIRLDSNSALPPETNKVISSVRAALNEGLLGDSVVRVQMPTDASYAQQKEAGLTAKAEREAQAAAAATAEQEAQAQAEAAAIEAAAQDFVESPDLLDNPELDEMKAWEEEMERKFALPEADFALDYTRWAVLDATGGVRSFDSAAREFIEE